MEYSNLLPLFGQPVPISINGGAGVAICEIQPPAGEVWILAGLNVYHDDTTARVISFSAYNGVTQGVLGETAAAIATSISVELFDICKMMPPVWVTNGTWLRAFVPVITAGKIIYVRGLIYKVRGIEQWSNL